jgi:cation-transporting ATPase 13A2
MSALREATVGVSLCEAETSVAAPVTSRLQTPGAVIDVLKEGRCSLITAYVLISFNVMYAVIQLFMVCLMYKIGLKIGDATYLIQDLFFTLVLGLAISLTPPSDVLSKERPPPKFLNAVYAFKLFGQMLCFIAFQLIALEALKASSFYDGGYVLEDDQDPLSETYSDETSVISIMGLSQVLIASVVSTIGHPFRVRWFYNPYHVTCLFLQSGFVLYQLFARKNYFLRHILVIKPLPYHFCFIILIIMAANAVSCIVIDLIGDFIGRLYFGKPPRKEVSTVSSSTSPK